MKFIRKLRNRTRSKMEQNLEVLDDQVLGSGNFGVVVKGRLGYRQVAVKKVEKRHLSKNESKREETALSLLAHENVIKLYHVKDAGNFRLYVLELCEASLDCVYLDDNHVKKYRGVVPTDLNILLQFSRGLEHVHKYLIHRDIKPENIFIANEAGCVRIKVGDFGFSKPVSMNGSFQLSGLKGTPVWMAPELLLLLDKYQDECLSTSPEKVREFEAFLYEQHASTKSDVFSAGCVFFYVVTKGTHPFGWTIFALEKIKTNRPVFFNNLNPDHFAVDIIRKMIAHNPEDRMKMLQVTAALETLQAQVHDGH